MDCTNIGTYIHDNSEYIYRVSIKRFIFTPHEMNKQYSDESIYWDTFDARITDAIEIPGDILLEFHRVDEYREPMKVYDYFKLSEVHISRYEELDDDE